MYHDLPINNHRNSLIEIINSSYVKPKNMIDHFKKLKLAEFYEKRICKCQSNTDAAKAVELSLLTINRYTKDQGFKPERKITRKTRKQINQI